jgi:hypothetical protein
MSIKGCLLTVAICNMYDPDDAIRKCVVRKWRLNVYDINNRTTIPQRLSEPRNSGDLMSVSVHSVVSSVL